MKLKPTAIFAAVVLSIWPAAPLGAESAESRIDELETALGAMMGQSALVTFFAINSLSDAYVENAYSKADALDILAVYEGATSGAVESLTHLKKTVKFTGEDQELFENMLDLYTHLERQLSALRSIIEDKDPDAGIQAFERNRQKAVEKLDALFGE